MYCRASRGFALRPGELGPLSFETALLCATARDYSMGQIQGQYHAFLRDLREKICGREKAPVDGAK
jgi:hypothetical protein